MCNWEMPLPAAFKYVTHFQTELGIEQVLFSAITCPCTNLHKTFEVGIVVILIFAAHTSIHSYP